MKKIIITLLVLLVALPTVVLAQNLDKVPHSRRMYNMTNNLVRTEIVTPQVNGYNVYKADLHIHTLFSDGDVTPALRIAEAWYDGLDIIAITDHLEARTYERKMLKALAGYNADGKPHRYSHAGAVKRKPRASGAAMLGAVTTLPSSSVSCLKIFLSCRNGIMSTNIMPSLGKSL